MKEIDPDQDYISPDQALPTSGISPLAMLQETCRNIGNDTPSNRRETYSKPRHGSSHRTSADSRVARDKLKKAHASFDRVDNQPAVSVPIDIRSPATPVQPPVRPRSSTQPDYSQYAAAADYQLMYQRVLYQKELEKLQLNLNPLISSPNSFLPTDPLGLSPPPRSTNPIGPTDFAKLAAFFYQKLQQNSPSTNHSALGTTTEALQNYRKLFPDSNSHFLHSQSHEVPPVSPPLKPQLHECHWVTTEGYCGKKHYSYEDLMLHLRSHASSSIESSPMFSLGQMPNMSIPTLPSHIDYQPKMSRAQNKDLLKPFSHLSYGGLRYQPYGLSSSRQLPLPFLH